ncbi:MAG: FtsK/SpoIIIE domain-containing protein [Clostridiales bacterium]
MTRQHNNDSKRDIISIFGEVVFDYLKRLFNKILDYITIDTINKIIKSRKEKVFVLAFSLLTSYFIIDPIIKKFNLSTWGYLLALPSFYIYKSVLNVAREDWFKAKYYKFYKMFDKKVSIINVKKDKKTNDITFMLYSYISKGKIEKEFDEIEHYFNTSITNIIQDKKNLRLIYIVTNKFADRDLIDSGSVENRLLGVLRYYNFNPMFVNMKENDFIKFVKIRCLSDIARVISKSDDIASKLRMAKEDLNIKVDLDTFVFEIKKKIQKIYYFEDYLRKFDVKEIKKKYNVPMILGVNLNTGKVEITDITKLLHILIAGAQGSGKSCGLNCFLQSTMYFGSNCVYVMTDFKKVELSQYKHFQNTIFINNHDDLLNILQNINEEMEKRYELLETFRFKKIESYNLNKTINKQIPYILLVIDEISDIALSGKEISKKINEIILRILNMGRAAGILAIFATQRPSAEQLNTDVRDRLSSKISFRVTRQESQKMVGVYGTEKLKTGEFVVDSESVNRKYFKGLFIDEDNGKNSVYENLEKRLKKQVGIVVNLEKEKG